MKEQRNLWVRFKADDKYGLWKKGDEARYLGLDHPGVPPIHLFELNGRAICLTNPFSRGIVTIVRFES